ncbi:hypothetical protein [Aurantiacibacter sediminis]|uniref:DUF1311 domain-containing protein n=1 Tax=Aurantiacibacter sediminis TaxID=2793064 RepID=A0ABS0N4K3_9SPHN|nr:hypothetical protein [Aurantiacibacter sediminis]MBH5322331.1 hypothetical protein [Aurantiacibacter sediminis]
MRKSLFTIPALGITALGLAACNQNTETELTEEQIAVCDGLQENLVDLQKRASGELGEAVMLNQMRAQGALENPNIDPTALAQFSLVHYEARLGNMLTLLEANGCDMPTEPVDGRIYSRAAGACLQARANGQADAVSLCEQDNWEPNEETSNAAQTPAAGPAAPAE